MKQLSSILFILLCVYVVSGQVTTRVPYATSLNPPLVCVPGRLYSNAALKPAKLWEGNSDSTCADITGSGAATGTVTSVSGTTNQIDVATGTTTPALSFPTNGIIANNVSPGLLSTATAAGTTTLTVASKGIQVFTGATTQTVVLPVVTTLPQLGFGFAIQNDSSGALTVNSSGGNLVQTMAAGTRAFFTCKLLTGTTAASWNVSYISAGGASGTGTVNTVPKVTNATGPVYGDSQVTDDGTTVHIATASGQRNVVIGSSNGASTIDIMGGGEIQISQSLTNITNSTAVNVDSGAGVTIIGDPNGAANGTTLTVDDAAQVITAASNFLTVNGSLQVQNGAVPFTPAGAAIGSAALPFAAFFIGNAASQSVQITGTFTGNRVATFPDATGTVQLVGAANTGAILGIPINNTVLATATGTVYSSPGNDGTALSIATEGNVSFPVTRAGTIRNLFVRTGGTAKTNTPITTITIRKGGVDTSVTLVMTQTVNTTTSDTVHSFTVVAGDLITISFTTTGTAAVSTSIAGVSFEID